MAARAEAGGDEAKAEEEDKEKEKEIAERPGWADALGFKLIMYTTGLIDFERDLAREGGRPVMEHMKIEVSALDSEALLTQLLIEFFETAEASLLIIVTNVLYDGRQRILLVKNKLSELREKYARRRRGEKNVLFVIRTLNKSWAGLSLEAGWKHILLENIAQQQKDENPLSSLEAMMAPIGDILDSELVFNAVFEQALPKAVSKVNGGREAHKEALARFERYRNLFFENEGENKELLRKKLVRQLEPMRRPWYQEIAFNKF